MVLFRKSKKIYRDVDPDEIFMDTQNLPSFDMDRFEGRIEKPISSRSIVGMGVIFVIVGLIFSYRLVHLQIAQGKDFFEQSENNSLDKVPLFADRGVVFDRNQIPLIWNNKHSETENEFLERVYIPKPGFAHILGYTSEPAKDKSGNYWQSELVGKDGVEKSYNSILEGETGVRLIEKNAMGEVQSQNIIEPPTPGTNLTLTIDSVIQEQLYLSLAERIREGAFMGGAATIMDVHSGEIIALTSYPEYNSNILSHGDDAEAIRGYLTDSRKPFLNKVDGGDFTPGSILKPFVALAALQEGVVTPNTEILSTGSISLPNPYNPKLKSIFLDWKAHGWVNIREAIAVSSDVYFYEVGGGFQNQKGIGIANIEKYSKMFGIAEKTGVDLPGELGGTIPTPEWKKIHFKGDAWRVGDTYHTSIGQYGFQVTPIQMVRATAAIASGGELVTPHVLRSDTKGDSGEVLFPTQRIPDIDVAHYSVVREGMHMAALPGGTAAALANEYVSVAAKTGTAQVGLLKTHVNSWVIGFFPYNDPKYAFTVMLENGPANNSTKAVYVLRNLFAWMSINSPEYLK